jgi:hypothetical protein
MIGPGFGGCPAFKYDLSHSGTSIEIFGFDHIKNERHDPEKGKTPARSDGESTSSLKKV